LISNSHQRTLPGRPFDAERVPAEVEETIIITSHPDDLARIDSEAACCPAIGAKAGRIAESPVAGTKKHEQLTQSVGCHNVATN
jgi:hypothetical protein